MAEAFFQAGIPREAISIYPGLRRRRRGGPRELSAQPDLRRHGDRRSLSRQSRACRRTARASRRSCSATTRSIDWETFLDVMVDSVFVNSGRGCINCSGIWASRHTREIATRSRERLAKSGRCRPTIRTRAWRRSRCPGVADAISQAIDADLQTPGVTDVTAKHRDRPRVVKQGARRLPAADRRALRLARGAGGAEGIHVSVRDGGRVPGSADARDDRPDAGVQRDHRQAGAASRLIDAAHIDRLNLGPVPTIQLNWLQPHEGNIVDFLFRARAFQTAPNSDGLLVALVVAMKILSITAGAAGMYCGSCCATTRWRSSCWRAATTSRSFPLYTPTTHRRSQRQPRSGALRRHQHLPAAAPGAVPAHAAISRSAVGLAGRHRTLRRPLGLDRSEAARRADDLDARRASAACCARSSTSCWSGSPTSRRRTSINLPNSLLIGLAGPLREALKRPICCTLQGEDLFLDGLIEPYRQRALDLIRRQVRRRRSLHRRQRVLRAGSCRGCWAFRPDRIAVVPLGIKLDGYRRARARETTCFASATSRASRRKRVCTCWPRRTCCSGAGRRRPRAPRSGRVSVARARTVSRRRAADARRGRPRGRVHVSRRRRSRREARVSAVARRAVGAGDLRRAERRVPARGDGERRAGRAAAARRVHRDGREDRRRAARRARRSRGAGRRPAPPLARSRPDERRSATRAFDGVRAHYSIAAVRRSAARVYAV